MTYNYNYRLLIVKGIKGKFVEESSANEETHIWNLNVFSGKQVTPSSFAFKRTSEWLKNNHPEEII